MNRIAEFRCRCGQVHGQVRNASPAAVNRAVCYCDDCQAFLHYLGRDDLLDAQGGTDIIQVAPAALSFVGGHEHIAGLRLTPKGLYRWYARCCNTPVGNTLSIRIPFVGLVAQLFETGAQTPDAMFGKPAAAIFGKYALGTPPKGSTRFSPWLIARVLVRIIGWRVRGQGAPHPFFDPKTGTPSRPVAVLTPEERESLRPLCGPKPAQR